MWDIQELFRQHAMELRRYLRRRVSSPEVAADLTQEAFLALWTARSAEPIANGQAYLFRTAANLAINHNRRERILSFIEDAESAFAVLADEAPSPERVLLSRQELAVVYETLSEFPAVQRAVFVMSRIEGLTYETIGRRLDIPAKTAFSHMVRILVRMQLRLDAARR